jgi:succinoglycan biosynthesis transport protein ExoP
MLKTAPPDTYRRDYKLPEHLEGRIGFAEILAFVRRNWIIFTFSVLLGAGLGSIYANTATPIYVARSKILLEKQRPLGRGDDAGLVQFTMDTSQIESQIQVMQSEEITRAVVRQLDLTRDRELMSAGPSLFRRLTSFLREDAPVDAPAANSDARLAYALAVVEDRLNARRIGQSYVIEVTFWSDDASKASRITNAITAAYIRNQLAAKALIAENGTELIAKQIASLRLQVEIAGKAVETGVIDVQNFPSADARVITAASPPLGPSWPRGNLVMMLGALLGLIPGLIWAAVRELPGPVAEYEEEPNL